MGVRGIGFSRLPCVISDYSLNGFCGMANAGKQ